jgi:TonB-dependent starch-binding outer membrane protein SusC
MKFLCKNWPLLKKLWSTKTFRTMRLTFYALILAVVQAYSISGYAQATKLNLDLENSTVRAVLQEIENISEFRFLYNSKMVDAEREVDVEFKDFTIDKALDKIFNGTDVAYRIIDRQVVLFSKDEPVYETSQMQQRTVSGIVTDSNGQPLPGVTVMVKGTTQGTVTNAAGNYSISNIPDDATLVFSFVGMRTQEIAVGSQSKIDARLEEENIGLEEIVAVGYGTQKVTTVTGSVSDVKGEKLMASPSVNFSNSIVGRIPGLVAVTRSGEPGSDNSTLRIRGANTLGDNSPLVVVDGIAGRDLTRLSTSDIESVTVLKDASAAIYGARAANGVILITTKRGQKGEPRVNITYNEGFSMPTVIPESIDAATYLEMLNEIGSYAGQQPKYSAEEIQNYRAGTDPWKYPNTDWYAETFQKAASQRSANASITGGQEKLNYFISAGTRFQDGIYKNSATYYKQSNFRINLDGQLTDNVKYGVDVSAREQNRNYPTRSAGDIFSMLRRGKPNMHAYWPDGKNGPDIEYGNNPVVVTTNQTGYDRNKTVNLETRSKLDISIPWIKGLSFSGNAALDWQMDNDKRWEIPWYLYSWDGVTYNNNGVPVLVEGKKGYVNPELEQEMTDAKRVTLNALMNYQTSINSKHNLKFLFGTERITGESMEFMAFRKYFVSTAIDELFAGGDAEKTNSGASSKEARINYFGRFNYDYLSKYLFEFVWRYDGSYIFPADKRFGFFPGVSMGWRISEEEFWTGIKPFFDYFKIRGSWGQTGNDRINTYQFLSSYGFSTGTNALYTFNHNVENKILNELRIPNPNVTWEIANQSNIGFDGSIFNNSISFSADYFYNKRTNILWFRNASVPTSSGLTLPRENIGEVANQGYELQLSYNNNIGKFNFEIGANFNHNKNKILFWDETPGIPEYQQSTGRPMNANLYYNAIGIFKDQAAVDAYPHWAGARPGDVIFEDVNKDEKIDGLDRIRIDKTDLPTYTGGLNIDLSYNIFYSSVFFQMATGAVRYDYYEMQGEVGNFLKRDVEGRWTVDNPNADQPRIWNRYSEYWRNYQNTYWLQNSDYIRLKNLEIGFNIPFSRQSGLKSAKVYFTGLNLLTFTEVKDFDPETTSATAYPLNKVYNFGIALTF